MTKLKPYVAPPEGRKAKLRLDFNENTLGCSPAVIRALRRMTPEDVSVYPEYEELRAMLAGHCGVKPENILLANGSDEALRYIFDAYLDRGQEIVIPVPTFSMIPIYARLRQARVIEVEYNRDLSFPVRRLLKAISSKTRIVILVNPNNPTGTGIAAADVRRIVRRAKDALVIVDEAYHQYLGHTAIDLIREHPNALVIQTLSKAYGLAGLRVGYVVGSAEAIAALSRVISPYSVNSVAVEAAKAALADRSYVNRYVKQVKKAKEFLRSSLNELGLRAYPSSANFFLVNFGDKAAFVARALERDGILVRDRSSMPLLKGCVRIGIGTMAQCRTLLASLRRILSPKAVIFDMDGVLVDVSRSYRLAIKKTAENFTGRRVTYGDIQKVKEKGDANNDWVLTKRLIDSMGGKASFSQVRNYFQKVYLDTPEGKGSIRNEKWVLRDSAFKQLAASYKIGISTGRPRNEAELTLAMCGMSDKFLGLVTIEDTDGKAKPHPLPVQTAMKGLHATECVYVGDTIDDIDAAVAAGCIPIGVKPAGMKKLANPGLLTEHGAKRVLDDINNLPHVLRELGF